MTSADRRRELSRRAWAEAFSRLFAKAGQDWPVGSDLSNPALVAAEHAANAATVAYVERGAKGARDALAEWERLMVVAIEAAKGRRGCGDCGVEKVAEVVMDDGSRSCGRCRRGQ
jgi:hypothetical protein